MNNDLVRLYNDNLPYLEYKEDTLKKKPKLHWGQRKLLMSEIDFLTRYYDRYDKGKKYLIYIGASPGHHINYLIKMFPDIHYILYDVVNTAVELGDNVEFHRKFFTDEEAEKYKNMNIFFVCDIRCLDIRRIKKKNMQKEMDEIIYDDMMKQKRWCKIIKPKSALLKFRLSWNTPKTTYFDGDLYFQIWHGRDSSEMRLVPYFDKTKVWDNKKIEGINYYHNMNTRSKNIPNKCCPCLGNYHESLVEVDILRRYLKKFHPTVKDVDTRICDVSLSITLYLSKWTKNDVNSDFLKRIDIEDTLLDEFLTDTTDSVDSTEEKVFIPLQLKRL